MARRRLCPWKLHKAHRPRALRTVQAGAVARCPNRIENGATRGAAKFLDVLGAAVWFVRGFGQAATATGYDAASDKLIEHVPVSDIEELTRRGIEDDATAERTDEIDRSNAEGIAKINIHVIVQESVPEICGCRVLIDGNAVILMRPS